MPQYITDDIKNSSDDYDEENSNGENSNEENKVKKKISQNVFSFNI